MKNRELIQRLLQHDLDADIWLPHVNDAGIPTYAQADYIFEMKGSEVIPDIMFTPHGEVDLRCLKVPEDNNIIYIGSLFSDGNVEKEMLSTYRDVSFKFPFNEYIKQIYSELTVNNDSNVDFVTYNFSEKEINDNIGFFKNCYNLGISVHIALELFAPNSPTIFNDNV